MAQLHKLRLRGFYSLGSSAQSQTGDQLQAIGIRNLDESSETMAQCGVDSIIGPTGTVRGVKNLVRKNRKRYNNLSAPIEESCREEEEELRETLSEIIEDVDDSGISCQSSECEEVPVISPRSSTSENMTIPSSSLFTTQQPVVREDASKSHFVYADDDTDGKAQDSIVIYTTSMGGVRETIEDCRCVLKIFRNLGLKVDERDVYMHKNYFRELDESRIKKPITLPQIFINGEHVGGKTEIEELNECGQLREILQDFERLEAGHVCETCAGFTYINCTACNGSGTSRKMRFKREINILRCTSCNENGLQRCPTCCKT